MAGTRIETGPADATCVPGVWAAGNLTDPQAQVITSAAAGLAAGRRDQPRPHHGRGLGGYPRWPDGIVIEDVPGAGYVTCAGFTPMPPDALLAYAASANLSTSTASSPLQSSGPSPVRSQRSQWRPESRKLLAQSSSSAW